jgi:cytochrome c5
MPATCAWGTHTNIEEIAVSSLKKVFGLVAVVGFLSASGVALSQSATLEAEMKARIEPVGSVCKAGESCAAAPVAAASSGPRSGKDVYDASCGMCHAVGVAGAPKLGDAADWSARAGKGIETLYTHAIDGFNGMPAMGLCTTCSVEEVKAAVDHMVDNSK